MSYTRPALHTLTVPILSCLLLALMAGDLAHAQRLRDQQQPAREPATPPGSRLQGEEKALPPLDVAPMPFDAGRVGMEDLIHATFRISNPTNRTMVIDGWRVTCKCTAPTISDRVIEPGTSVEVSASVDVRGTIGDVNKHFFLTIRGYERELPLSIRATMGPMIDVEPARLRQLSGTITLTPVDGRPFAFLGLHNEGAEYTAKKLRPVGSERAMGWQVTYRLPPEAPDTCLVIETDHREAQIVTPRLFTPFASKDTVDYIMPETRERIWSEREHVVVGVLDHGKSHEFECKLRRKEHTEGVTVSTDVDGLEVEIVRMDEPEQRDPATGYQYATYVVKLTNVSKEEGVILAPLYFTDPDGYIPRPSWMMGVSRPTGTAEDDESTSEG